MSTKKGKTLSGKTKRPRQMTKEELIATLLKKKQCNTKALAIVEGLLESSVDRQWLLDSLQLIDQTHYQDAVEERAILKICGYPLCSSALGNIPKQQYKISTQNNKVYDISERKNFCSNLCYRSSTFLKDQILTSPLWLRDIETVPIFKVFDGSKSSCGVGDEIDVGPTRVTPHEASLTTNPPESNVDEDECENQSAEVDFSLISSKTRSTDSQGTSHSHDPSGQCKTETKTEELGSGGFSSGDLIEADHSSLSTEKQNSNVCSEPQNELKKDVMEPLNTDAQLSKPQNELKKDVMEPLNTDAQLSKPQNELKKDVMEPLNTDAQLSEPQNELKKDVMEPSKTNAQLNPKNMIKSSESADTSSPTSPPESTDYIAAREVNLEVRTSSTQQQGSSNEDNKSKVQKQKRTSRHAKKQEVGFLSVYDKVTQRLTEWFTVDSVCFLYGEQRTREMLGPQSEDFDQNFKPLDSATWDPEKHERFVKICKRLNLLDLEDKGFDEKILNDEKNAEKKPLPDFKKLKEEAEKMDLRVRAFYKGQLELEPRKVTFADGVEEAPEAEDEGLPVLPLVHQHEQRALRRRLVLDALNRVLPDLLRTLGVHSIQINSTLRGLVGTFALTAKNITFNPREWILAAVAIIKMLAVKDTRLNHALTTEASQKYLTLIQMSYNLSPTFLDLLLDQLVSNAISPSR